MILIKDSDQNFISVRLRFRDCTQFSVSVPVPVPVSITISVFFDFFRFRIEKIRNPSDPSFDSFIDNGDYTHLDLSFFGYDI